MNDINGYTFTCGTSSSREAPRDFQFVIPRNPYGVRILGRGAHFKNKRQSLSASPSGSSTNVPATQWESRMEAVQSTRTRDNILLSQVNHHQMLLGNWNILTLTEKKLAFVEKQSDILSILSEFGSGTVDLDGGWKLFYSGADSCVSAQAGVGILTSPRLSDCVSDWIPLGSTV